MNKYTVTLVTDFTTFITSVADDTTDYNKVVKLAIEAIRDNEGFDLSHKHYGDFVDVLIERN